MLTAVPAVSTTRSPASTIPVPRAASSEVAHSSSTSARSGNAHRRHAPLERHVLERVSVVREPDDRPPRAQPRDRRGRPAGEGRDEQRLRLERLGDVAGRVRHRLPDRRLLLGLAGARAGSRGSARPRARSGPCSATDSTGNSPTAVSPESMIAVVPSRIAFATSDASARVGSGAWIIDSSICVAVITGLPRSSARRMIRFCSSGTSAAPISTPRSPRATITRVGVAEDVVEHGDRLGLLDLRDHVRGRAGRLDQRLQRLARRRPSGRTRARRSRRRARARTRGRRCPSASATGSAAARPGRLTPLCERDRPADEHLAARAAAVDLVDAQPHRAVVDQHVVPGLEHRRRAPPGAIGRSPSGAPSSPAIVTSSPRVELDRRRELADPELRPLQVGDQRERPAELLLQPRGSPAPTAAWSSCVPCEKLSRAPSISSISGASTSRGRRGGPDRGDDLRPARARRPCAATG